MPSCKGGDIGLEDLSHYSFQRLGQTVLNGGENTGIEFAGVSIDTPESIAFKQANAQLAKGFSRLVTKAWEATKKKAQKMADGDMWCCPKDGVVIARLKWDDGDGIRVQADAFLGTPIPASQDVKYKADKSIHWYSN